MRRTPRLPFHLLLLGPPQIQQGKHLKMLRPERALYLLAYLAARGRWVGRNEVCALLWPDAPPAAGRHNLRQLLLRIRHLGWAPTLEPAGDQLRWLTGSTLHDFRRNLQNGRWKEALEHHTGPLLQGCEPSGLEEFATWLDLERHQVHTQWLQAATAHARELQHQGDLEGAFRLLQGVLREDLLAEDLLHTCLELAGQSGHTSHALQLYQQFRRVLQQEMGIEPGPRTRQLVQQLLHNSISS